MARSPDDTYDAKEMLSEVASAARRLSPMRLRILLQRARGDTLEEIGDENGVSRERIRCLAKETIARLARDTKSDEQIAVHRQRAATRSQDELARRREEQRKRVERELAWKEATRRRREEQRKRVERELAWKEATRLQHAQRTLVTVANGMLRHLEFHRREALRINGGQRLYAQ